jgi:hypothetical protein
MLIDDLVSNPILVKLGILPEALRGRLSKVPKFMLRRDFAMAADEFSLDVGNVSKVLPLARLPYPECWLEVAQADRHHFASGPREPTDGELSRVGFLLTQLTQQGAWSAQMFWSFAAGETFLGIHLPPAMSGLLACIDPVRLTPSPPRRFAPMATCAARFFTSSVWRPILTTGSVSRDS